MRDYLTEIPPFSWGLVVVPVASCSLLSVSLLVSVSQPVIMVLGTGQKFLFPVLLPLMLYFLLHYSLHYSMVFLLKKLSRKMLRIMYRRRHRNLPKGEGRGSGPQGRINRMRQMVTSLVRDERIEGIQQYVDESRGYAERVWDIDI